MGPPTAWRSTIVTWMFLVLLVGLTTVMFDLIDMPSPALFGGLVGALALVLGLRRSTAFPRWGILSGQAIIGVTVGASIDWGTLADLGSAWPAVAIISVATLVLSVAIGQILRLHRGVSMVTASFASVAGGASGMVALADDLGADSRVVTVIQYLRVLLILLTIPVVVSLVFHVDAVHSASSSSAGTSLKGVAYSVLGATCGVALGKLLRLPSPAVLGALLVAALLALVPAFSDASVPPWVQVAGFLVVGTQVGLRFTPESIRAIGRMLPTALLIIGAVTALCAAFGLLLARLTGVSQLDAYLATTPGGLYAVLATSSASGGNLTFVTAAQVIRLLLAIVATPLLARWLVGRVAPQPD